MWKAMTGGEDDEKTESAQKLRNPGACPYLRLVVLTL